MSKNELIKIDKDLLEILLKLPDIPIPFEQKIELYETKIAGTSYIDNINEIMEEVKVGDSLALMREVNNKYDENAILIKTLKNQKLGYIPQFENIVFARLLDAGKKLTAEIKSIAKRNYYYYIKIKIFLHD